MVSVPSRHPPEPAWLEHMYNNRALVPAHPVHLARWAQDSTAARRSTTCALDIAYGSGPGEKLDVFPAHHGGNSPVLVFVHGGYWRALDKADHSFVAPPFSAGGACVVVPNYALCPSISVPGIALQMVQALAWVWRHIADHGGDPARITVVGHSAGGHLAAMLLACRWPQVDAGLPRDLVKSVLSISGLYELDSIRRTPTLQQSLQLSASQAVRCSPAWYASPRQGVLMSVAGGDESAEFLRHNRLIQQAWGHQRVPVCETLPGCNHFSVLEALVQPGHRLNQLAWQLLR
ncbi:MAG: hypothetical protein RLZZ401_1124 [Pseudomonadota bacterium]